MVKLISIIFALSPIIALADTEEWALMSREGECAEVKTLERKVADLGSVNTPTAFVELMKKKGLKTAPVELPGFDGNLVQVDVPQKGLYLIFIKKSLCKDFSAKPNKSETPPLPQTEQTK